MPKIPVANADLRKYVLRTDIRRLLCYLSWLILWIAGAVSFNLNHPTYPESRLLLGWKLAVWILVSFVSGFFLFRIQKFFTERTIEGEILASGLTRTYAAGQDPRMGKRGYDFRLHTTLRVRCTDGKIRRLHFEQKNNSYFCYREGEKILRFHGLPYPINLSPTEQNGYVCPACGRVYQTLPSRCEECRFSVPNPKELSAEAPD